MPDEPRAEPALDEIERRLAAFETATKRLTRTVSDPDLPAAVARSASSAKRAAVPPQADEISGLRPAVAGGQGPATGALTARRRSEGGQGAGHPGFTSAFGKPSIPAAMVPAQGGTVQTTAARRRTPVAPWWRTWRGAAAAAALGLLLVLAALPRLFRELPEGQVWAETVRCTSPAGGTVEALAVQVGDSVPAGALLARIGGAQVTAPQAGVVVRLLAAPESRLAGNDPFLELALPATLRVVVALPGASEVLTGDRVSVRLPGENRVLGGMVERVLTPGEPGLWPGGAAPRRAAIVLEPSLTPPRLGQAARVTVLGQDPGPLRLALFSLRRMLSW